MATCAVTPLGNASSAVRRFSSSASVRAPCSSSALATFRAWPSTLKSRSRTWNPPSMSRIPPPARNRLTPAAPAARECQFRGAAILVERQCPRSLLLERLGHLQSVAFYAEVQVANLESAEHVAHPAAGQKQVRD